MAPSPAQQGAVAVAVVLALTALLAAALVLSPAPGSPETSAPRFEVVGHLDPASGRAHADVWAHAGFAYVGTFGTEDACPADGVKVIDLSDPARPRLVAQLADFPGTSAEDVVVRRVATDAFEGDLLVTGVQACDADGDAGPRGISVWDVTDPRAPVELASVDAGPGGRGAHEVDLVEREDGRVLAAFSVPGALDATDGEVGDFRLVDLTDPRAPEALADWDVRRDAPRDVRESIRPRGELEAAILHAASFGANGTLALLSHWDAGVVLLDVEDPRAPQYVGRTAFEPDEEGNAHSASLAAGGALLLQEDEDFWPDGTEGVEDAWGRVRVFDVSDPARPREVAEFAPPSLGGEERGGFFSAHHSVASGRTAFTAWYSAGVVAWDFSDPAAPRVLDAFVPPPSPPPAGFEDAPRGAEEFAFTWGVALSGNLVLASDAGTGLWVLRLA